MKQFMEPQIEVLKLEAMDIMYQSISDNELGWDIDGEEE